MKFLKMEARTIYLNEVLRKKIKTFHNIERLSSLMFLGQKKERIRRITRFWKTACNHGKMYKVLRDEDRRPVVKKNKNGDKKVIGVFI